MSLSAVTWCPPFYVRLGIIATVLYPIFIWPVFRSRRLWISYAPALLASLPLLGNFVVSYMQLHDAVFYGAVAGSRSPIALAAGLSEAQAPLIHGAFVSLINSAIAVVIAIRRGPPKGMTVENVVLLGLRPARILVALGLASVAALFGATLWIGSSKPVQSEMFILALSAAAAGAGGLFIFAAAMAAWLARRSKRVEAQEFIRPVQLQSLLIISSLSVVVGVAAWTIGRKFSFIAMHGFR
jgi:hypothetical protein